MQNVWLKCKVHVNFNPVARSFNEENNSCLTPAKWLCQFCWEKCTQNILTSTCRVIHKHTIMKITTVDTVRNLFEIKNLSNWNKLKCCFQIKLFFFLNPRRHAYMQNTSIRIIFVLYTYCILFFYVMCVCTFFYDTVYKSNIFESCRENLTLCEHFTMKYDLNILPPPTTASLMLVRSVGWLSNVPLR